MHFEFALIHDFRDGDGHTHSWILASDLLDWDMWDETITFSRRSRDEQQVLGKLGNEFASFLDLIKKIVQEHAGGNPNNLRLVYWFDN